VFSLNSGKFIVDQVGTDRTGALPISGTTDSCCRTAKCLDIESKVHARGATQEKPDVYKDWIYMLQNTINFMRSQ
jgi:hypothetical protein